MKLIGTLISPANTMAIGSGYVPQAGPATEPSVGVNSDVSTVLTFEATTKKC